MGLFKKFFTNKTTVTIIGVIAGVAVLVGFYTYRVNTSVSPTKIPVAKRDLKATDEITDEDITYVKVNQKFLKNAQVFKANEIKNLIDHYVAVGTSISKGAMFYKSQVVEKKELPNAIFDSIPDGNAIYQLSVDTTKTYANSIFPGDKIHLYLKTTDGNLQVFGRLVENIEVLAVRDSVGNNVFDVTSNGTPSELLFAVDIDMYRLLKIAEYRGLTILPVPINNYGLENQGDTLYSNDDLVELIKRDSLDWR